MFEIEKTYTFEAGHVLKNHDGKCSHLHGHSYILKVVLRSESLIDQGPKTNMVIDFSDIGKIIKPMILEYFDHRFINDTLKTDSPTAEFIAKWIYDYVKPKLSLLYSVTVYETATSRATYYKT